MLFVARRTEVHIGVFAEVSYLKVGDNGSLRGCQQASMNVCTEKSERGRYRCELIFTFVP